MKAASVDLARIAFSRSGECGWHSEKTMHFLSAAHQLAWMEHPAIWLLESCAILWLVLRVCGDLLATGA